MQLARPILNPDIFNRDLFFDNLRYLYGIYEYDDYGHIYKLTTQVIADRLNVSRMSVSNWLNGKKQPSFIIVIKVNLWVKQLRDISTQLQSVSVSG